MLFESTCPCVALGILIPDTKTTAVFLILLKPSMEWWTGWRESSVLVQMSIFQIAFFHNSGGFERVFNRKYRFNRLTCTNLYKTENTENILISEKIEKSGGCFSSIKPKLIFFCCDV